MLVEGDALDAPTAVAAVPAFDGAVVVDCTFFAGAAPFVDVQADVSDKVTASAIVV